MSETPEQKPVEAAAEAPPSEPNTKTDGEKEKLQQDLDKARSEYLYLRAEFDNYRKQAIKERSELTKYAGERVLGELVNALDNMDRALQMTITPDNIQSFSKGMHMIADELKGLLTRFGVVEVPADGVKFDPSYHEALSSEETDKVAPGHVARVFRKAYKFHDKVLRTGQVVVAREKSQ